MRTTAEGVDANDRLSSRHSNPLGFGADVWLRTLIVHRGDGVDVADAGFTFWSVYRVSFTTSSVILVSVSLPSSPRQTR